MAIPACSPPRHRSSSSASIAIVSTAWGSSDRRLRALPDVPEQRILITSALLALAAFAAADRSVSPSLPPRLMPFRPRWLFRLGPVGRGLRPAPNGDGGLVPPIVWHSARRHASAGDPASTSARSRIDRHQAADPHFGLLAGWNVLTSLGLIAVTLFRRCPCCRPRLSSS